MPQICLYLQLHQPYRLQNFNVFDIGKKISYFSTHRKDVNKQTFIKVAKKSYLPMLQLLLKLAKKQAGFKFALSFSGVFLEQVLAYEPKIVQLIKALLQTGKLELLTETYYHSLAFLYSKNEFLRQIKQHQKLIKDMFGIKPAVFRNTELIYANNIADWLTDFQFQGILTEAVDRYLDGSKRTQIHLSHSRAATPLLLKHAPLSDDLAFRFSDRNWQWYPLTVDRYLEWVEIYPEDEIINLFMDFETFGEHQWEDTGIFIFFEEFVKRFLAKSWNKFVLPSELFAVKTRRANTIPKYDVPDYISWADVDRDLTAWRDNDLQVDSLRILYELEKPVLNSGDQTLIEDWRRLQTSDHFYYMCTKWSADGDVHAYFNPYKSPFEAYRRYSIVLADLRERLL